MGGLTEALFNNNRERNRSLVIAKYGPFSVILTSSVRLQSAVSHPLNQKIITLVPIQGKMNKFSCE